MGQRVLKPVPIRLESSREKRFTENIFAERVEPHEREVLMTYWSSAWAPVYEVIPLVSSWRVRLHDLGVLVGGVMRVPGDPARPSSRPVVAQVLGVSSVTLRCIELLEQGGLSGVGAATFPAGAFGLARDTSTVITIASEFRRCGYG